MPELWQLFDEQAKPLKDTGATPDDVFGQGLLHGASHVWMWRNNNGNAEVLLQKRAANKRTWPNRLDISAAGHIDLGEDPLTAALREAKEEIGLDIDQSNLQEFSLQKGYNTAENGAIENEYQWLYLLELPLESAFTLQESEVDSLIWKDIKIFSEECGSELYVPHSTAYYEKVVSSIQSAIANAL